MTNKEIKNICFNNADISALYYGSVLVWKKNNSQNDGDLNFSGVFNDTVNSSTNIVAVQYEDGKNETVHIPYDETTKEFNYTFENPLQKMTLSNRGIYETITHFPNQSNLIDCNNYFNYCSAKELDLSNFDTSNVTNMRSMFSNCNKLTSLDLSNFDTSNVTNMRSMFSCKLLTSLDLSNFDTSNVTNMRSMFSCKLLTSLDLSNFDTSKVTDMSSMFNSCDSLTSLDLSNFDTSKVTGTSFMFSSCVSLTTITGVIEGTKVDIDLSECPLTNSSAMVFINGLANVTSTKNITFKDSTYDTLTEEQIAVATSKGWSVIRSA